MIVEIHGRSGFRAHFSAAYLVVGIRFNPNNFSLLHFNQHAAIAVAKHAEGLFYHFRLLFIMEEICLEAI